MVTSVTPEISTLLFDAGIPNNSPSCVPLNCQCLTKLSPSPNEDKIENDDKSSEDDIEIQTSE